jgi:hypothetical protein
MINDRTQEARIEAGVISELSHQPLYALELVTALEYDREAIIAAVSRLDAVGLIDTPVRGGRFQLT